MYKVYWTTNAGAAQGQECSELKAALDLSNALRLTDVRFVTVIGEDPNCTSKSGAIVMERADYHWKKRRI
jgi:hypothetical protein